jgi:hypothetical protein
LDVASANMEFLLRTKEREMVNLPQEVVEEII